MKKIVCALLVVFALIAFFSLLKVRCPIQKAQPLATNSSPTITANTHLQTSNSVQLQSSNHLQFSNLKCALEDFTDFEKAEFSTNFITRYKPALKKWSDAFAGRVPLSPDSITTSNFVVRVGTRPTYREYIFVVDGITLGIQDANGVARVDYLNAPKQTGKMTVLPTGGEAPISITPISKDELVKILSDEGGTLFKPNDIRLIPSGYSGALNGGAIINVGGTPDNAASWKYDMVIAPDGKLAYYLKGK